MSKNLFFMVMEADGDEMTSFDADNTGGDIPPEDIAPPAMDDDNNTTSSPEPPSLNDNDAGMDFDDALSDAGGDSDMDTMGDSSGNDGSDNNEEADKDDTKLSDKANNILNEELYKRMVARNNEIDEILNSIKQIVPLLPSDVVKNTDSSVVSLKTALAKGRKYVVDDFVDAGYGENLLFFNKLDSLYKLLLDKIDKNLKKINTDKN